MATFDDFIDAIITGSKDLAKDIFDGFESEAKEDAEAFLEKSKEDLKRWTILLAQGEITKQDFNDLIQAKKALAEIHRLRQTGVALTKIDRFKTKFMNLVVDTAFNMFL